MNALTGDSAVFFVRQRPLEERFAVLEGVLAQEHLGEVEVLAEVERQAAFAQPLPERLHRRR